MENLLYTLYYLCPLVLLIAPFRYGLRIAFAILAAICLALTFEASPHPPGGYDSLGIAIFFISVIASLVTLTLRGVSEKFWPTLRGPFAGRDGHAVSWLTNAVIAAWSALIGLWITNAFAFGFADHNGGLNLHLRVAAIAGAATLVALILTQIPPAYCPASCLDQHHRP